MERADQNKSWWREFDERNTIQTNLLNEDYIMMIDIGGCGDGPFIPESAIREISRGEHKVHVTFTDGTKKSYDCAPSFVLLEATHIIPADPAWRLACWVNPEDGDGNHGTVEYHTVIAFRVDAYGNLLLPIVPSLELFELDASRYNALIDPHTRHFCMMRAEDVYKTEVAFCEAMHRQAERDDEDRRKQQSEKKLKAVPA